MTVIKTIASYFASNTEKSGILELYQRNSLKIKPSPVSRKVCRDPMDLPVLGTCIAANADYLITGDKDLLTLKKNFTMIILSPREFYETQK